MVSSNSSQGTTTQQMTDPEAARRMAAVSESAELRAQDQYNLGRELYEPYERDMVAANRALIDPNRKLVEAQLAEEAGLAPLRGDVTRAGLQDTMADIDATRGLKDQIIANQTADMKASAGVGEAFFESAMEGVDPTQRMGEAQTDVATGFAKSQGTLERDLARSGVNLTDDKATAMQTNLAIERAKAIGGARTGAARSADQETFARLATAMQAKGNYNLPGVASTATTATGALPMQTGTLQIGGYQLQSGVDKSLGFTGAAIQANQAGMNALTQGSSKSSGWGFLSSTERVKYRISKLNVHNPHKIHGLEPVTYRYKGTDKERFGFIAEEVMQVLPEIVEYDENHKVIGYQLDSLICLLVADVQQQAKTIEQQSRAIKLLMKKVETLLEDK